ncbi:ribose 5-phosphate isomerase [Pedobacter ginsenosidimutans]|uniref:Ribose-5-phosphate isomerase A n=1 Tax=Pedobacter ginsenosidimutans TaxID=687842 RepID=A0A0T5VR44_9SPHI|nr:ribose-5-phosphate isomerase RpiA [Pedobacter ginsenosidimutans]KRT16348.1 ribose 5-phosphate isomerase [Pedobacter ginsenosidimutans]
MATIDKTQQDAEKLAAALAAVKFVKDGDVVGLGTGSTTTFAIKELGKRVKEGLKIKAAASSIRTEELAKSLGIEILDLGFLSKIDISIDGADEFTESLDLIKGGGGALFREKIIASLSKNAIIITDASKKVKKLGAFTVPVEVIPLAYQYVFDQINELGGKGVLRSVDNKTFITDNGNLIIDADFGLIDDPEKLSTDLNQINGLLAHGLFINITSKVIMSEETDIIIFE